MPIQVDPMAQPAVEDRCRVTVYLDEEDLASLDELKAHFRRTQRRRLDRSQLIREAIRSFRLTHMEPDKAGEGGQDR